MQSEAPDPCERLIQEQRTPNDEDCAPDWALALALVPGMFNDTFSCLAAERNTSDCLPTIHSVCQSSKYKLMLRVCSALYLKWADHGVEHVFHAFSANECEEQYRNHDTFDRLCYEWVQHYGCGYDCPCTDVVSEGDSYRGHACFFHEWEWNAEEWNVEKLVALGVFIICYTNAVYM